MSVDIIRITPDFWERLRVLRLEMLQDTPHAYGQSLDQSRAFFDEEWRYRAQFLSQPGNLGLAAVERDTGTWVGTMSFLTESVDRGIVATVYVAPRHRGTDLASRLLDGLLEWARANTNLSAVHLLVHEDNPRARAFYRAYGFSETGITQPYVLNPLEREIEMVFSLTSRTR